VIDEERDGEVDRDGGVVMLVGDRAVTVGLLVRLEAKRGKEDELAQLLRDGLSLVLEEAATPAWFALRMAPATFGIFDAFPDENGRQAHLAGRLAAALIGRAAELLAQPPSIERVDVLAAKFSG
jgi:quinol monooxygenase YgiN